MTTWNKVSFSTVTAKCLSIGFFISLIMQCDVLRVRNEVHENDRANNPKIHTPIKKHCLIDFKHAIFDPKCQVKNQEKSTKKPVFEMHKRSIKSRRKQLFCLSDGNRFKKSKQNKKACVFTQQVECCGPYSGSSACAWLTARSAHCSGLLVEWCGPYSVFQGPI